MSFSKNLHHQGILLLIVTTMLWGTSFPLLKQVLSDLSPAVILASRSTIAAIALAPYLGKLNLKLLRDGSLLGLLYFSECALALVGLETISANRSAFLVSLNVILVPILGALIGRRISVKVLLAAGVAIVGISLMSWEGSGWSWGDALTFGCAIGIAVYILTLEAVAPRHSALPLVAVQLGVMALLSLGWAMLHGLDQQLSQLKPHFNTLLYLGLAVSAVPLWTQALAQRWVSASETALLYTLEPVFASVFSFLILNEALGIRGVFGAGLVLLATVLSQFPSPNSREH